MHPLIVPVLLAGGSGTRLWPLSRKNFPKQFLTIQGESSLLQQTMARIQRLDLDQCLIISNEAHYFLCQEQLQSFNIKTTYILEPYPRNTAPAIAAAAHYLKHYYHEDAVMLILPTDHWIGHTEHWATLMQKGADYAAQHEAIVTFGITPTSGKTEYGYIEVEHPGEKSHAAVKSFHEKPDFDTAENFYASKRFFWNSGMFACKARTYLSELKQHADDIFIASEQALLSGYIQQDYLRLEEAAFSSCRNESIDYAIMEKTTRSIVFPAPIEWSDLGSWTAVAEAAPIDDQGNTLQGNVLAKDSHNCLISSDKTLVTTLGIHDQIIIATTDAILVADKGYAQEVKTLVNSLAERQQHLAIDHVRVVRPWGYYEILAEGPTFKVKRLMVKPGAKLSLQLHHHRAEHWVVVEGEACVINDTHQLKLKANQSTYIPQNTKHRLSNLSDQPLFVIEVQSGSYLGEDDIIRFDDVYQRPVEA